MRNQFKFTAFAFVMIIFQSCSIFAPTETTPVSQSKISVTQKDLVTDNPDFEPENMNLLFDENDFFDYSEATFQIPESDTINDLESLHFEDTLLMQSNLQHDNFEIADDLLKESRTIQLLDSLASAKFFKDDELLFDRKQLNIHNYAEDFIPTFPDSVYEARIAALNKTMPFELTYNRTVKNFINLYAVNKRELTSRVLGLAEVYFPLFEEILDRHNLPLELKYLAVVESALIPTAGSHAGAKGLWQFMYRTGKVYDLQVTSYVDDRFDPIKSTIAAARHLQDLYDIYRDWALVLAAYNSGAGNVNRAIRRSGGIKNYWAIWPFLPRETRGYVPAFIAVTYVMNHAADHNLYPVHPGILYNAIDTVHISDILSFDQISEFMNIPIADLRYLNPSFKEGIIPANPENKYILRLPRALSGYFVSHQEEIYNYKTKKGIEREKLLAQIEKASQRDIHIVKSGETLGHIARRYRTSVRNLQSWNNLRGTTIYPGQRLVVFADASQSRSAAAPAESSIKRSGEQSQHIVKSGENLGLIARKYRCSVDDLKNWNNLRSSTIHPNQRLIVYKPESAGGASTEIIQTEAGEVKYLYHTVKAGDTLWDIAKQYDGVTVDDLKRLNNITRAKSLQPGQKIRIAKAG
jgi:membrane-bound lytic murein transglycosylase D